MKISEIMPNLLIDGGIFKQFNIVSDTDFGLTAPQLGVLYNFHSGDKTPAPILKKYLGTDGTLTSAGEAFIGTLLDSYFGKKWQRILDAFESDYNPLENYDRQELSTDTHNLTDSTNYGAHTTQTNLGAQIVTGTDDVVPFNNENEYEVGKNTNNAGARQDSQTSQAHTDSTGHTGTLRTDSRIHGNIGVTTSQQMLQSEIELRQYNLAEQIFKDIDTLIALKIYA